MSSQIAEIIASEMASLAKERPGDLALWGRSVFSQSDEDGIIEEIFRRIGTTNKEFVEFGVGSGYENNTRLLLEQGWRGLWIEGEAELAAQIRDRFHDKIATSQLRFVNEYVNVDNINAIIASANLNKEIDLLSIDIDGNDFHVFDAINVINPRCLVLEHNYYAPPVDYVMPYDPRFIWDFKTTEFGASIVALARLAKQKGYRLVGTGMYSPNGFYVREDLIGNLFYGTGDAASNWRVCSYEKCVAYPKTPFAPRSKSSAKRGFFYYMLSRLMRIRT